MPFSNVSREVSAVSTAAPVLRRPRHTPFELEAVRGHHLIVRREVLHDLAKHFPQLTAGTTPGNALAIGYIA
jgi:hypothetical protein